MSTRLGVVTASILILSCIAATASAQDFSFSNPSGQTISLSSLRGSVVVMLFSGSQDPQRREGLKALESLADRYQGKNVKILWVSVNAASEMTNDQLKSIAAGSVSVVRDNNQAAFRRFSGKVAQLPTVVVLDRQGNPVGQPRGGFNPNSDFINDLASIVEGLLQLQ